MLSNQQVEAVRSGKLDAGFIFSLEVPDGDVAQLQVAKYKLMLAAPWHYRTNPKQTSSSGTVTVRRTLYLVSSLGESRLL